MITWFSTGALRAGGAGLLLGALGLLAAGGARAEEAAAPSAKAREKKDLSEARLASARAAAGAGRAAEARALFGEALAAGLAADGQASADAAAPRPASVVSIANEQPDERAVEATPAPPDSAPVPAAAPPVAAAPEAPGDADARRRQELARETAEREDARREAERAATPAGVPVVAAQPSAPPGRAPAAFQAGVRLSPLAKDATGAQHLSAGLAFGWVAIATPGGRGSVVLDLESSRWQPGRNDRTDRAQVAFYGLGFDWTVPFASGGTGLFVGAEVAGGVLQSSTMTTAEVHNDGVLQVMPHVGGAVAYRGVGLFADAGWRFQLLADDQSGQARVGGVVVQGGLRLDMERGEVTGARAFDLGYTARFISPNGSRIWSRYGGVFGAASGPLVAHEVDVTTNAFLPAALHMDQGLALTYVGAGQDGGGGALTMLGLGWLGTWHAFATHQLFDPFVGLRLGFVYISNDDAGPTGTFQYTKQVGLTASGMAGLDVAMLRRVALRAGVAYDAVGYANNKSNASLSGYAVLAGVVVRP
jgi:hypothetical protein